MSGAQETAAFCAHYALDEILCPQSDIRPAEAAGLNLSLHDRVEEAQAAGRADASNETLNSQIIAYYIGFMTA